MTRFVVRRWEVAGVTVLAFLGAGLFQTAVAADEPARSRASSQGRTDQQASSEGLIPPEMFLSSPFAGFFRAEKYAAALDALEVLAKQYPNDPLIIRYRAIVLDRLGRYDEAIALYNQLLARDPNHTPTKFFLGQTYAHQGDPRAAADAWQWVVENSPSDEYRRLAQEQLGQLEARGARPTARKRFSLVGDLGVAYDSNPLLKSHDKVLATPGNEQQAERFAVKLSAGYQAIRRPEGRFDVIYTMRQSLHDRGLDEVNFTSQELALDARKRVSLWDRDVVLGSRYELLGGFLDGDLFSLSNRFLLSSDLRLTPHTRTYVYDRFTVSNFGPDGSNPPQTSRDGVYEDVGVLQYLYSEDFLRYLYIGQELEVDQTRGANFTRRGTSTRLGAHAPVSFMKQTDLDLSGTFRFGKYPRFTSLSPLDPERREDTNWNLTVSLTHYWTTQLATRLFYDLINANNRNDFFQYDRHIAGVQLLFNQSF